MNEKFLLLTTLIAFQVIVFSQNVSDTLTTKFEKLANTNSIKGFGVAIFTKDSVLYKNGFGYANTKNKIPYTTTTIQKIASISKLLLGVSVMKAQEMGILSLEDDINKYLPFKLINDRYPKDKITIRHLATHTSGLKKLAEYDLKALCFPTKIPRIRNEIPFGLRKIILNKTAKKINTNKDLKLEEFLFNLYDLNGKWFNKNHFKNVKAGKEEIYSNNGASLLGLIIEKTSGMSYSKFIRKYILSELQMNNSGFDFEIVKYSKAKKSSLYHAGIEMPNDYKLILYPAGGFESNIEDFSKFMLAMARGYNDKSSILTKVSFNEMLKFPANSNLNYGILWEIYPSSSIGHSGDIVGVRTYTYYNKNKDRGYIFFCNTSTTKTIDNDIDKIIETLKDYYERLVP